MLKSRKIIKCVLIIVGSGILLYLLYFFFAIVMFSGILDSIHTKKDLIANYNKHETEILDLKRYINSITPENKKVEIEFKNDRTIARFSVSSIDSKSQNTLYPIFLEFDLKTSSEKIDSVIESLGWTQKTLKTLKEKLDKAGCIEIESGAPTRIGFQRYGMAMYFYNIFDNEIPDSLRRRYNDSCKYILHTNKLVLEYTGGAIGPQCFEMN